MVTKCPDCGKEVKNLGAHKRFCVKGLTEGQRTALAQAKDAAEQLVREELNKIEAPNKSPGSHIFDNRGRKIGKQPWTMGEIEKVFSLIEYTPDETVPVTWNGVSIQCFAGVSQLMPTCFKDIMEDRKRRMRLIGKSLKDYDIDSYGVLAGPPPGAEVAV